MFDNLYFQEMEDARQEIWEMHDFGAFTQSMNDCGEFVTSTAEPCDISESEE